MPMLWRYPIAVVSSFLILMSLHCELVHALDTSDYTVMVSASVQESPPQITLSWPASSDATGYTVYRKTVSATSWGTGTTLGTATNYTDSSVSVGSIYEYRVVKTGTGASGYGYICAGINAPLVESRGKLVLIVDNTYASDLSSELTRLQQDLIGDGWQVLRHDVAPTDTVVQVKNLIKTDYLADTANVKAVFLFGHVPVPYSGNSAYDGHTDHQGAWPADVFYGEMDGTWTDTSVNNTTPGRNENDNIPGDGKYDQSSIPSDVELQVGRVDLYNMPAFAPKTELDLLRQYLNKDHNFRQKIITAQRRGLVDDGFGTFSGEAFAASGWRNFSPMFGASNVSSQDWFPTLSSQSYLWAYGCGGGSYNSAGGVGNTTDFASNDTQAVFTMMFGSYFGDWDVGNSFLRAPLATTTYGLTCAWAGRPHWFVHHMGQGETIGYSTRVTQNNNSLYQQVNYGGRGTHVALMGDPSLRMHVVAPPTGLSAVEGSPVELTWSASTDSVAGYHVYRSANATGPYTRLTTSLIIGTSYSDSTGGAGSYTYMVRAVKLENTPSGSYFNPSQGAFATISPAPTTAPEAPSNLAATTANAFRINLAWTDNSNNETSFRIERKTGAAGTYAEIASVGSDATAFADTTCNPGTEYYYKIRARNSIGNSVYSNEANATTNVGVADGNGIGLPGEYFDNIDLTATTLTRIDPTINFAFGTGSPDPLIGVDTFSIRWLGKVQPKFTETYTFYVTSDDGARLWVNGQQLINNWVDQGPTEKSGTIALVAGQKYDITLEYYENGGGADVRLSWSSASEPKAIVPQKQLYPASGPGSNANPLIDSPATATPSTVEVGQLVVFAASASDADGDVMTITWDFGDGSPVTVDASHVYVVAGEYTAIASISDGKGGVVNSSVLITVLAVGGGGGGGTPPIDTDGDGITDDIDTDDDNDGVSDSNEIAMGTDPLSASSMLKTPMTVLKIKGAAKFTQIDRDLCAISGIIPDLPALFDPNAQIVTVDVGGAVRTFTLDAKGRSRTTSGSFQLKLKGKRNKTTKKIDFIGGAVPFKVSLARGAFAQAWADEGIDSAKTVRNQAVNFTVDMKMNGKVYTGQIGTSYSGSAGKSASFKNAAKPKR